MFGLTRREQRWKAEQQAAETVLGFLAVVAKSAAEVRVAEANAEMAAELRKLREENEALRTAQKKGGE